MSLALSNFWNLLMPVSMVIDTIDSCNFYQNMEKGKVYYIFNKEYPSNYTAGSSCKWVAESPPNSKILLSCNDIHMPKSANCHQDRLEVSSGGRNNLTESHRYCGEGSMSLLTHDNKLEVVLRSQRKSKGGRYLCSITALPAPESIETKPNNTFPALAIQQSCTCGWKNDRRIVGGHETKVNEYPSMAALLEGDQLFCGATIVSSNYVLTAAHCFNGRNADSLSVLVGDHDIMSGSDTSYSAVYRVRGVRIYPYYNPNTNQGDIAIVAVDRININENVGPICLPFRFGYESFYGETVTVLGWGQLEFTGPLAESLQEVDLDVISNEECATYTSVVPSEICTYTPSKDACQADSGGPLLYEYAYNKRLYLVGIISHGVGCGSANPGVNTRVTSYLDWIWQETRENFCSM